eukprot:Rhum_TRINITY_DN8063_c0_g1::Rhum_TRINITY_DN8063_c0_g1_i1::g.25981::m.25981
MGGVFGGPRAYGDPLPKEKFQMAATTLMAEHTPEYDALTECSLRYTNEPVTERCRTEMAAWNLLIFESFCHRLYKETAKCQKKAGDSWTIECKDITNELVECGDVSSRKLFQFNLENKKAEKKARAEDLNAAKEAPKTSGGVVV